MSDFDRRSGRFDEGMDDAPWSDEDHRAWRAGAGRTVDSLASERRWAKAPSAPRVADGLAPAGADAGAPDDAAKDRAPVGAASPAIDSTQWIEESVGWFCAPPLPEPMIAGVQARGDLGPDAERVRAAAAVGVTGAGQALPHLATIQASFGPAHDLSAVRAHVGGAAADAATSIGATAYATGRDVAFAAEPDLHTAAHEAAHVVQQQAGVHLAAGVGHDGDPYERHADAIADRVVAGESAADLLAAGPAASASTRSSPASSPASPTTAVQRRRHGAPAAASAAPSTEPSALARAVAQTALAVEALRIALARRGSIDAPSAGLQQALDRLAAAVHQEQAPRAREAAAVRAVLEDADVVIRAVGARNHDAHPTLERVAASLGQRVGRVVAAAAAPVREVNAGRVRAWAEFSAEQLEGAIVALRRAGATETPALREAARQAQAWAEALVDPDSASAQATAHSAGRAIEDQFTQVRAVAPRLVEVAAAPPSHSTRAAVEALADALAASSQPSARRIAARRRADVAYQHWQLDAAKTALDSAAESDALLRSMGQHPSGAGASLGRRWASLEADAERGQLDGDEAEALAVEAEELALYRQGRLVVVQCRQLAKVLADLDGNDHVRGALREAADFTESLLDKHGKARRSDVADRRAAVEKLRGQLGRWFSSHYFLELLGGLDAEGTQHEGAANEAIETAQTAKMVATLAMSIAISLASMGIAAAAGGAARGAYAARFGSTMRGVATAKRVGQLVTVVTDVALNTAGQKLLLGDPRHVGTLALINGGMVFAGAAIERAVSRLYRIRLDEARFFGHFHITVTHLSADVIMGAAVDYAGSRLLGETAPTPETVGDWLLSGATLGLARGLGNHVAAVRKALAQLHGRGFDLAYQRLRPGLAAADALVARIEAAPDPTALAELYDQHEALVRAEAELLDQLLVAGDAADAHAARSVAGEFNRRTDRVDAAVRDKLHDGAGLSRDADGSARGGAIEVAVAADTAARVGLAVDHDVSDVTAPRATVTDGDHTTTFAQDRRTGRIRDRGAPADPAELARRQRQLASIRRVVAARQSLILDELSMRTFVRSRRVQVGAGPQGAIHQGAQPPAFKPRPLDEQLTIADGGAPSVLANQGDLRIGQHADAIRQPGLPVHETSLAQDAGFVTSAELDDAMLLGWLEAQASMVDGRVIGRLELRPANPPADGSWQVPEVAARARLRLANGKELWVYSDGFDDLTGAGAARVEPLAKITDPETLAGGRADGSLLAASDPQVRAKLIEDGRILAVPGSPSADWGAEMGAAKGSQVDLIGDVSPGRQAYWNERIAAAKQSGDPAALAAVRSALEIEAHPGLSIPRNRAPGAAGDHPNIHLGTGRPTSITRRSDGRYEVVLTDVITGEAQPPKVYDQIVYAYGQTKATHLLELFGPPPPEGILVPVFYDEARTQLVGLRHEAANYVLRGAGAFAADAEPWVRAQDREAWGAGVKRAAAAGVELFDGRTLSPDSTNVSGGLEVAGDRLARGAVADARRDYQLPGTEFALELGDRGQWAAQIRRFMVEQLPAAPPDKVRVTERSGGTSGDAVYDVTIDGVSLGVWKVFGRDRAARAERAVLKQLAEADLATLRTPRERGGLGATQDGGEAGESVLMDAVPGTSLEELGAGLVGTDPAARAREFAKFQAAVVRAAQGLAELHAHFTDPNLDAAGRRAARKADADHLLASFDDPARIAALGGRTNADAIRAAIRARLYEPFLAADLPPSAYHGNAQLENFTVDGWDPKQRAWRDLYAVNVGEMSRGFPEDVAANLDGAHAPKGDKPAAGADLGRLLGALESKLPEGALSAAEVQRIQEAASKAYLDAYQRALAKQPQLGGRTFDIDSAALKSARDWYRIETEVAAARTDPRAVERLGRLLTLALAPIHPGGTP
jgi:hypothetical protein